MDWSFLLVHLAIVIDQKMVPIFLANLNKGTISLLVVEQPHGRVANNVWVDVNEILPIL